MPKIWSMNKTRTTTVRIGFFFGFLTEKLFWTTHSLLLISVSSGTSTEWTICIHHHNLCSFKNAQNIYVQTPKVQFNNRQKLVLAHLKHLFPLTSLPKSLNSVPAYDKNSSPKTWKGQQSLIWDLACTGDQMQKLISQ